MVRGGHPHRCRRCRSSDKRETGRFDFAPLIAAAVLVFLSMVMPVLISGGGFDKPLYVPLIFAVIPAIEALILSGIAYAIFGRRKTA